MPTSPNAVSDDDRAVARMMHERGRQQGRTSLLLGLSAAPVSLLPSTGWTLPTILYGLSTVLPLGVSIVAGLGAVATLWVAHHLQGGERAAFDALPRTGRHATAGVAFIFAIIGFGLSVESRLYMTPVGLGDYEEQIPPIPTSLTSWMLHGDLPTPREAVVGLVALYPDIVSFTVLRADGRSAVRVAWVHDDDGPAIRPPRLVFVLMMSKSARWRLQAAMKQNSAPFARSPPRQSPNQQADQCDGDNLIRWTQA
jgi:hypothetical protein